MNSQLDKRIRLTVGVAAVIGLILLGLPLVSLAASGNGEKFRQEADAFFSHRSVTRVALEIPESGMALLRREPRTYVRATLREGAMTFSNVAVHLKGAAGSFRQVDDLPGLTLSFSHFNEDGPRFHGLKKIHFNNSVQDPSRLSELVAGQMFREAGVPAARAAHALVELNGRRLGLYVALEAMNKDFLARYFKNPRGNLYGQSRRCDVTDHIERMEGNNPLTWAELTALASAIRQWEAQVRMERLEQTLDVERFLSFMALEIILSHWDGYTISRHNYRIYHDLDSGRLVFLPHDLDQLMVRSKPIFLPQASGLVAQAVLNTPALRARYEQRVCTLATNLFKVARWQELVDQAVAALLPPLQAYDLDLARAFTNAAANFRNRITYRGPQLERQVAIFNGAAQPAKFTYAGLFLRGWVSESFQPSTRLERIKDTTGKPTLWISASHRSMAAWRTQVVLKEGRYRFEGLVRCAQVEVPDRRWRGGGVMLTGPRQIISTVLTGDAPWQKLACEFEVKGMDEVDLGCEFRALQGEAWFDEDSLRLVRLE